MNIKKFFKWPKEVYIFWIASFIMGIDLINPILLIFFKDWGGLDQTQIQILQSWMMLWIFILEIPTGVFGDVKGKKFSVILGYALIILGTIVYSIIPNIWMFALAEFIFALGIAFISGAEEAWMYDISKELKIENKFREISVIKNSLIMLGMFIAAILFIPLSKVLPVQQIFRFKILSTGITLTLLALFIPPTDGKNDKSLRPSYIETAKKGISLLRNSTNLKEATIYLSILGSTSYFVIWLYQEALSVLEVPKEMFGVYNMVLLIAEIFMVRLGAILIKKCESKRVYIVLTIVVALGFLLAAILKSILGVVFLLVLSGGLGLQVGGLLSKEINEEIDSEQRATVLSLIGMVRRLVLTIFNPFIGCLVDSKGVFIAFAVLGIISFLAIFSRPKFKLK
jgi:MFS family permease